MDTVTLELTAMAHGGAALGRVDRKAVFVPYGLPGETVRVEITDDRERFAFARLIEILEPSPERVPAPCPYFGPSGCGGCQWQHTTYEAQLRFKADVVADQLSRIGGLKDPTVLSTLADDSGWAYRNRARFHPSVDGTLGFRAAGSHEVVAIEACPILHPHLQELYSALDLELTGVRAISIRVGVETGDQMLIFEMVDDLPPAVEVDLPVSCVLLLSDGPFVNLIGSNTIREQVAGHTYRVSAPAFFQVNTAQAGQLVRLVLEYLDLQEHETVLDAYSGVGLFTTHLAERSGLVIAIEADNAAVEDLIENTGRHDNVEAIEGPVEAVLPDLTEDIDAAVVDPPRTGIDRFALDALVSHRPARIVYVSCDPATLARDTKRLTRAGYQLLRVQPVDVFPQTYHVESVSLFAA